MSLGIVLFVAGGRYVVAVVVLVFSADGSEIAAVVTVVIVIAVYGVGSGVSIVFAVGDTSGPGLGVWAQKGPLPRLS